jgi:glucose dehydrogenase
MAWSRRLPKDPGSTPIVYRGVMYLYAPGASIQAVDATNGDLLWEYVRNYRATSPPRQRETEPRLFEDMIYFAAPDGSWSPSTHGPASCAGKPRSTMAARPPAGSSSPTAR